MPLRHWRGLALLQDERLHLFMECEEDNPPLQEEVNTVEYLQNFVVDLKHATAKNLLLVFELQET